MKYLFLIELVNFIIDDFKKFGGYSFAIPNFIIHCFQMPIASQQGSSLQFLSVNIEFINKGIEILLFLFGRDTPFAKNFQKFPILFISEISDPSLEYLMQIFH